MTIQTFYTLFDILREIEVALCVDASDYDERDCDIIISNVKTRLSRQYQVDFTNYKVTDSELELSQYKDNLYLFVGAIANLHGVLSGYCQVARYKMYTEVSLASVSYLGVSAEDMGVVLKCLQYSDTYDRARAALTKIKVLLPNVSNCLEKRLFLLLIIADSIGLNEVVSCISEILYLGSL